MKTIVKLSALLKVNLLKKIAIPVLIAAAIVTLWAMSRQPMPMKKKSSLQDQISFNPEKKVALQNSLFSEKEAAVDTSTGDKTLSPYFIVLSDDPSVDQLPLKSTSADVHIAGVIADVEISQVYKNSGKNTLEAIYTFPASTNAAVYSMEMYIGKRKIVAKIKEKQKARAEYEQAKADGNRASLLEQSRPNVFQMNVANISPGDEIKVCLKYTEMLVPENGTYKFVYPTVVAPRYSNKSSKTASPENKFVASPYLKEKEPPTYKFHLAASISAGLPIQNIICNSHKINTTYPDKSSADIKLDSSEKNGGNRDFILEYKLAGGKIQTGLMLYQKGNEKFFMMMVQPPKTVKIDDIPPREYIFIVDGSGSMHGFPLDISKKLLRNLITNLRPVDKFNVIVFSSSSETLSPSSLPATSDNVDKALTYIDSKEGACGTEILPALKKAFALPRTTESLSRSFVIMTDGDVDVEKESFDLIRNSLDKANFFAFGIGSSVNRYIIEGMAHVGMGEPMIATNEAAADELCEKFRTYVSSPVLTEVKKNFGTFQAYDVEPYSVPDILAERPVIIYGKYKGEAKGTITISGYSGLKKYSSSFDVSTVKPDSDNVALRYLWAREKIKYLDDYNDYGKDSTKIQEVTALGLKYNLLTAYTSFIAVDKTEKVDSHGKLTTVEQALPLPENVSNYAVGADMGIDDETANFRTKDYTVYSSIIVHSLDKTLENSAIADIEGKISSNIKSYLLTLDYISLDSITVAVNGAGNVTAIEIKGSSLSENSIEAIKKIMTGWDFSSLGIKKEWQFVIKF